MAAAILPFIACPPDIQLITAETQPEDWRMCRLYVLVEPRPFPTVRYLGSTVQPLCNRDAQHKRAARADTLSQPLYRYCADVPGGQYLDDWEIRELYAFQYDPVRCPDAPRQLETYVYGKGTRSTHGAGRVDIAVMMSVAVTGRVSRSAS